jgi:hypothetical protein
MRLFENDRGLSIQRAASPGRDLRAQQRGTLNGVARKKFLATASFAGFDSASVCALSDQIGQRRARRDKTMIVPVCLVLASILGVLWVVSWWWPKEPGWAHFALHHATIFGLFVGLLVFLMMHPWSPPDKAAAELWAIGGTLCILAGCCVEVSEEIYGMRLGFFEKGLKQFKSFPLAVALMVPSVGAFWLGKTVGQWANARFIQGDRTAPDVELAVITVMAVCIWFAVIGTWALCVRFFTRPEARSVSIFGCVAQIGAAAGDLLRRCISFMKSGLWSLFALALLVIGYVELRDPTTTLGGRFFSWCVVGAGFLAALKALSELGQAVRGAPRLESQYPHGEGRTATERETQGAARGEAGPMSLDDRRFD